MNELFFISLYLLSFSSPLLSPALFSTDSNGFMSTQPGSPAYPKPGTLFVNPWSAGALEMARANKMDSTMPWAFAIISSPIMILKQFINVVQLVQASRWLAEGDLAARKKAQSMNGKKLA